MTTVTTTLTGFGSRLSALAPSARSAVSTPKENRRPAVKAAASLSTFGTNAAKKAVFTTMLMFWGAALMWSVDCVFNAADGEGLFDISREDTILGFIILAAGLLVFGALSLKERLFAVRA